MAAPTTTAPSRSVEPDPDVDPRHVWTPDARGRTQRLTAWAVIGGVLLLAPHVVTEVSIPVYIHQSVVFAIVALSLNVLIGYTGQVSLGHAAFVGLGAFGFAVAQTRMDLPLALALPIGVVAGAGFALGLGAVALRVKGLYFALVTIVFGVFCQQVLFNLSALTGGGAVDAVRPALLDSDIAYSYFLYAMLALIWLFDWRLTSTKAGRAIQALRDDERVAASWGINVRSYKLLAFALSGAYAGLAGTFLAMISRIVSAESFLFTTSLTFVLMTTFGGLGSRAGVVLGGVLYSVLPAALDSANQSALWNTNDGLFMTVGFVPVPGPQLTQLLVGAALVGGAVLIGRRVVLNAQTGLGGRIGGLVGGFVLAAVGAVMSLAAFGGPVDADARLAGEDVPFVLWDAISGSFFLVIGAVLVLTTLIAYPGGLAQLLRGPIAWLSFKQPSSETVTVAGGAAGGGMGARP